jgi:hypothetical protein
VGQQDAAGETEEAEIATGAVKSEWPGCRPTGPPHLHLRRQYGCAIETTFEEARSALGLETTRGRWKRTVLRAAPCLLGLYTVVAVLFHALPAAKRVGAVAWPGKAAVTFSDAMCAVRRWLWNEAVLPQAGDGTALQKLPEPIRELLLTTLAPAAGVTENRHQPS